MGGIIIAFKNFSFGRGILNSPWVGFRHFQTFLNSMYFSRLMRNTVLLSVFNILWSMPVPIVFALLLNEIKNNKWKRAIQTVSYFPHFVSSVIIVGMLFTFLSPMDGVVNVLRGKLGFSPIAYMQQPQYFRSLYIGSGVWQSFGWNSVMYIAALSAIPTEQYESARIDGAGRWQQMRYITLPGILPTFIILFILNVGRIMSVGSSKIILMYSPGIYDVSDVISTYVYRKSLINGEFSFGTAISLFNTVINFALVWFTNWVSKRTSDISLW
jgi:putative aldouronate transport system permease protein